MSCKQIAFLFYTFVVCVYAKDEAKEGPLDALVSALSAHQSAPVTVTPAGAIRGSWMQTRGGRQFQAYRGIRYAEPPVGELRFQPPKPIVNYTAEVDATREGPACPQPTHLPDDFVVDEDCLRLNVYTPGDTRSKLPVILFIHGGEFYSLSGGSNLAGPHYLLERDVVYVAINYRLGSLGFLSTGDELAPGNNGFKDQVAAMRWIQRNIAAFGGDPTLVTVAGYGAGSTSIALHMVSPMSKGLFHRAIAMSSSPLSQVVIGSHQKYLAERQARVLGCPTGSTKEILDCLKTKTAKQLGDSLNSLYPISMYACLGFSHQLYPNLEAANFFDAYLIVDCYTKGELPSEDPAILWNVVVEPDFGQERFLTRQPLDAIRSGSFHAVPLIISQTQDEYFWKAFTITKNRTLLDSMNQNWDREAPIAFMLPAEDSVVHKANRLKEAYFGGKPLANDAATEDALGKLYSDAIFGFSVHRMANLMCRHSPHKVFHYEFAYSGEYSFYESSKVPNEVTHHDEMIYLFSMPLIGYDISPGCADDAIVKRLTAIWYNFARYGYGDPNPRGDTPELKSLSWPVMTPADRKYLRIDKEFSVHQKLFEDRYNVWEELYPIKY